MKLSRGLTAGLMALAAGLPLPSSALAGALGPAIEGILGVPTGPGDEFWNYGQPTTLLERAKFVVSVSGQAANLLARKYRSGQADHGYTLGIGGGAIMQWEYGVTGVWALGSGQSQDWTAPNRLYHLSPSPKIGFMAASHAVRFGGWAFGGTFYRSSFSLNDTFVFNRFPQTSDPQLDRYLYSLLPRGLGRQIGYDAIGSRMLFLADIRRATPIGQFGVAVNGWLASVDWITQHENTIPATDALYDRSYLAGTKQGDGHGGWHGVGVEGRWDGTLREGVTAELRLGRGRGSGDANLSLRNPSLLPDGNGRFEREIESPDWGHDTLSVRTWSAGATTKWQPGPATTLAMNVDWARYDFGTQAFGRTPALSIDYVPQEEMAVPIEQAARVDLDGHASAVGFDVALARHERSSPWSWRLGAGILQLDGTAHGLVVPEVLGFEAQQSEHDWSWSALRLAHVELQAKRQLTSQISLGYSFRQYIPLSGDWRRDGKHAAMPGGISGLRFGSVHQVVASMSL